MAGARVVAGAAAALGLLAGCAGIEPPKPWQKGDLARPEMRTALPPLAERNARHVYSSREAAAGGQGVGAGGCGCN